jgi:primosomal protein N' (replication factor Y)
MTGKFIKPTLFQDYKITLKHRDFDKLKEGSMWLYKVTKPKYTGFRPEEPAII